MRASGWLAATEYLFEQVGDAGLRLQLGAARGTPGKVRADGALVPGVEAAQRETGEEVADGVIVTHERVLSARGIRL